MASLIACPSCARHVRADEQLCPFCRCGLPSDFGAGPVPMPPPEGLSRFQRYRAISVGTGVVAAATALTAACSSPPATQTFYGAAPIGAGALWNAGHDAGNDARGLDASATADAPETSIPDAIHEQD
jgi:hypothetical protein